MLKHALSTLILASLTIFSAVSANAEITAGDMELVGSERVSRTVFDFTYRLNVTNADENITAVSAKVSSSSSSTGVMDADLSFPDIAAGRSSVSSDTFTIRQDRTVPFDPTALSYAFSFEISDTEPDPDDKDSDGFTPADGDCNDDDPNINPAADSIPDNNIDENCDGLDPVVAPAFSVRITSPASLVTVGSTPVTVVGSVDDSTVALTVNGAPVTPESSGAFSVGVDLQEGHNSIVVRGVKGDKVVTDSITVSLDMTPPYLTIESHTDGQKVYTDKIIVTGLVNDIVRGTIEESQAKVSVNGVDATISNRSYSSRDVSLVEGSNQITVTGTDQVGNVGGKAIFVDYVVPPGQRIELVSGQNQEGIINADLDAPLAVKVVNDQLEPVADAAVVFRVIQGSGAVAASTAKEGRAEVVQTGSDGMAVTAFKLGSRVGSANHKVRARVVGYDDEVVFSASAMGNVGNKLSVNSGNNQRGAVGQILPEAFVVAVTDDGANVVQGARVLFEVGKGGGQLTGSDIEDFVDSYQAVTDSDGRATSEYRLGFLPGIDAQRVTVTLLDAPDDGEGGVQSITAGFSATGFVPAAPGLTSISGVVLDNQDTPIPGVTVRIDGSERQDETDVQGQFKILQAPVGPVHLIADGSTADVDGEFPSLSYNIVTVAGVDNPLSSPVYMVKLDTESAVLAGPTSVELILDDYPGFKLEIAKDSVTFPDGAREGLISATAVNASKVPMAPPNGMQPQFIVTIQPTGTLFDPPARLTLPNVDAHAPGAQVEMYSYDHDLEEFVAIGLGSVSEDGTLVSSNPGVGVIKAGWHCGSQPGGSGCCENGPDCGYCFSKEAGCPSSCKIVPDRPAETQVEGNCQTELCSGSKPNDGDKPPEECGTCVDGSPDVDESKPLNAERQKPDDCKNLLCGGGYEPRNETSAVKAAGGDRECKRCSNGEEIDDSGGQNCGDGTPAQACYTCKNGACGNNCEASTATNVFENTAPGFVLSLLTEFPEIVSTVPFFDAEVSPFIGVSLTDGEQCCKDCATPDPQSYKKFTGNAGVKLDIKVSWPGLGGVYEMPPKTLGGYAFTAKIFITLAGASITIDAKGEVNFLETECPGEDCGDFNLGGNLSGSFGPQVDGTAAFVSCSEPKCKKDNVTIFALAGKGGGTLDIKGFVGGKYSSGPQCGGSCLGAKLEPVVFNASFSVSIEILYKKYSYNGSLDPFQIHPGGKFGAGCN